MSQQTPQGYPPPEQPDYSKGYSGAHPTPTGPPPRKANKSIFKRPWFWAAVVVLIIIISVSANSGKKKDSSNNAAASNAPVTTASSAPVASAPASTTAAAPAAPKYTVAEQQAISSAESYLAMGGGFSRNGLLGQLTSSAGEGFKRADAVFALNHIHVNYDQQAYLSAKGYLKESSFSRASLIDQLTSSAGEQFTRAQAEYAADKVGLK